MGVSNLLNSTIINKVLMAVTGLILVLFVTGHAIGNLQVYLGRDVMNTYAEFLQSTGELLWAVRLFLFLALVIHIYTSIKLKFLNLSARPEGYKIKSYVKSTLYSRTMIWTGIMIFLFVVYHILHFTAGVTDPQIYGHSEFYGPGNIFERHDVYKMVVLGFRNPLVSVVYIAAVTLLGFHLAHAIQSMFQSLGITGPSLTEKLIKIGKIVAILITLIYIAVPAGILLGLVGGEV